MKTLDRNDIDDDNLDERLTSQSVDAECITPTTKATNGVSIASSSASVTASAHTSTGVISGAYQATQTVPMTYTDLTKTVNSNGQGNNNEAQIEQKRPKRTSKPVCRFGIKVNHLSL